jgi:hypothetical protein
LLLPTQLRWERITAATRVIQVGIRRSSRHILPEKGIGVSVSLLRVSSAFVLLALVLQCSAQKSSSWVHVDSAGKLVYRSLPQGDHIVDFSYAGYGGGGVALPAVPVMRTVTSSEEDDAPAIQRALDEVSAMPLKGKFRGAVLLAPGHFKCGSALKIAASGVVLRGSGSGVGGSTLELTGVPHVALMVGGDEHVETAGRTAHIAQAYVPSGTMQITLDDASGFTAGDRLRITRMTTPAWLKFMGMDDLVRNGKPETWVGGSIATERSVVRVEGKTLFLDVPLTDSYDRKYLPAEGAEVIRIHESGAIEQSGVEALSIVAPELHVSLTDASYSAIHMRALHDGWVRDLHVENTTGGIGAGEGTRRITIEDVSMHHSTSIVGAAKPADFGIDGTQVLVLRCSSQGDSLFYVVTGARNQGPNAVLDSEFHGNGHIQPHQRWSTGLLVENTRVPEGGIDLMNRGEMGSGHGWTMGWGVVWNSIAQSFVIQSPPGAANWSIGNKGEEALSSMQTYGPGPKGDPLPQGIVESANKPIEPASLYRAQLSQRLGAAALAALIPAH